MIRKDKGFTLIELLVVIAIIGILSSVILASLNTARGKGNDAKVKAQLSGLRASAEIYYDNQIPPSYGITASTCTTASSMFVDATSGMLQYATQANYPTNATLSCFSDAGAYAVSALLPGVGGTNSWCVDSVGNSMLRATPVGSTVCQ